MASPQLSALAKRVARLEKARLRSKQPTLSFSSVEDGAISVTDVDDNLVMLLGKQYDNTFTSAPLVGPPPPRPTAPLVTESLAGLKVYWDGTFEDGAVAPMDFARVTIHAVPSLVFAEDTPSPTDQQFIVGIITSATGGEILSSLPYEDHVVFLVAWSQAGKFSAMSDTATGRPRKVEGPDIEANSVTANAIETGVLEAGFVLSGRIQVGEATWTPEDGLLIPQPRGVIHFPVDGVTPATISADANLGDTNIEGFLTVSGDAVLTSELKLQSGVPSPRTSPTVTNTWPSISAPGIAATDESGPVDNGDIYRGLCTHPTMTNLWAVSVNYFGGGIRLLNKTDGTIGSIPDPTTGKSWAVGFRPSGIASYGGMFYIIGYYSGDDFYSIHQIDPTTYDLVGTIETDCATENNQPGLFAGHPDLAMAQPVVAIWSQANGTGAKRQVYDASLSTKSSVANLGNNLTTSADGWVGGVYDRLDADSEQRLYLSTDNTALWHRCYTGAIAGGVYDATRSFQRAKGAAMRGFCRDTNTNFIWAYDQFGRFYQYSKLDIPTPIDAGYTWYDGDNSPYPSGHPQAGVPSGTHETAVSPKATYTIPPRAWALIEAAPPPHQSVTDPTRVDKADRVGMYASYAGQPMRLQAYMTHDFSSGQKVAWRTITLSIPGTGGPIAPTTDGFLTADTAPATIYSEAERLDGSAKTHLNGSGSARLDGLIPPGVIMQTMSNSASAPVGWLWCDGSALSTSMYPDLFAAIGYEHGGSGSSFNLPNMNGRFLLGTNTPSEVGDVGGSSTILGSNLPPHTHGAGTLSAGTSGSTHSHAIERGTAVGTAPNRVAQGNTTAAADANTTGTGSHTHSISGTTGDGPGTSSPFLPPYIKSRYMIRT